ncbi:hypothetical protein H310_03951 [Aphanomyces invadans]|uniref:PH domain-containing protein n=1 Tax=Aphanomyces invadans TaxID=157072 RepID=A0A024UEW4_9STRA|nr:hypothetical protein H310_03951 [Aphanomyces invadans]ETW04824.1 hypothetical protein H310_03951 [Aphanomyces invadans]|eukprot:XP_008866262.1 hypothetical protein H310_03951 [Aphanomyces invadans]
MSVPAAQCPVPPEIEGYLYKMKRKTGINLTGSWNKRWFYVDVKRKEFGYSVSHSQPIMKSSIFLDDITAIVVFDDYCFQVESKGRKFFLKGESKAGAAVWVKTLETYRSQFVAYEKYMASTPIYTPPPPKTADVKSNNGSLGTPSSGPVKTDHAARKTNQRVE